MIFLDAISLVIDEPTGLILTIARDSLDAPIESTRILDELPEGVQGRLAKQGGKAPIVYDPSAPHRGRQPLSIKEVRRYSVTLHFDTTNSSKDATQIHIESSLQNGRNAKWNLRKIRGIRTGEIQVINYIGTAWIQIADYPRIKLEITPEKIDYEVEYRAMVESIAGRCQQLLLDWNTPTTLSFSPDPEKAKRTLLEQFLFLRHSLGTERLDLYLEIISRNPHRALLREDRWGAEADSRFFLDPLRYGRGWAKTSSGKGDYFNGFLPQDIHFSHKQETLDTAPNRFVKYALAQFRDICQAVIDHPIIEGAANDEAIAMCESFDTFLSQQWLRELRELDQIPLNNQTLLRREGYRQLLEAWFLSDVAAQLDWEGHEDAYDGNNRDVATLYEFWLYFELLTLLSEDVGCEHLATDHSIEDDSLLPFIAELDGRGLKVNLKQGRASYTSFRYSSQDGVTNRLNLYYNRAFQQRSVLKSGSYSRPLRPDYSLVILPEFIASRHKSPYAAEAEAESLGQITYLHFDAKYRVETMTDIFGKDSVDDAEEERKEEKVTRTYKRGDLYKMHTYNEAIRRTLGSYVLYPGTDPVSNPDFKKYHELLPGVGAFALRPTIKDGTPSADGRQALAKFLSDVVIHQADRMTQSFRMRQNNHRIVKDIPKKIATGGKNHVVANPDTPVILGYMKNEEDIAFFRDRKFFYCWATNKSGTPVNLDLSISPGTLFLGYTGPHQQRYSASWCAEISRCELVTGNQLKERTKISPSQDIRHYLLFRLEEPWSLVPRDLTGIAPPAGGLAVQRKWIDIARAILKE